MNVVYKHVLALSSSGKRGLTLGKTNNLVAVDAQKLYKVTQEGHLIWALPLCVCFVTWYLLLVMGPSRATEQPQKKKQKTQLPETEDEGQLASALALAPAALVKNIPGADSESVIAAVSRKGQQKA